MKLPVLLVFVVLAMACRQPDFMYKPVPDPSTSIDGLELTFIDPGVDKFFSAIHFTSVTTGYVATLNGVIYKTSDGGNSWFKLNSGTTLPLRDFYFLSENYGFIVGGDGGCGGNNCVAPGAVILHTTDGGVSWSRAEALYPWLELESVWFISETKGFAVGLGSVLSTVDRGVTWKETKVSNLGGTMMDITFVDELHGIIRCGGGKIIRTFDGGQTWTVSNPFKQYGAATLSVTNKELIFAADDDTIQKSIDFGNSWSVLSNNPQQIFSLTFVSGDLGYAFGRGQWSGGDFGHHYGSAFYTVDGGKTWEGTDQVREVQEITSASFPASNRGYAITRFGVIKVELR